MSDFNVVNNSEFMIEKIKERPVNRRKLMKRTLITASLAVMFGLIACFTFLLLEPVISNWLYPEEEAESVEFPEDEEEMSPEDMLEDKLPVLKTPPPEPVNAQLNQEQVDEILDSVELDKSHYVQLYDMMSEYVDELSRYMVTVTSVKADYDWLENSYERTNDTSGVIIARNNRELYILTNASSIRKADKIQVSFYNGKTAEAALTGKHTEMNLAVISVSLENLGTEEELEKITVALLGSSKSLNLVGSPIVALGSPMGKTESVGYGMITAVSEGTAYADYNYDILTTDIYGSQTAQGVLFNMNGQIVGIITSTKVNLDMRNIVTAYGISDLRQLISILSAGKQVPYLGIEGISVTMEANQELQIPYGAYVTDVINNSPAMLAGIQEGDIIIGMNDVSVDEYADLEKAMYNANSGDVVKLKVMRYSQGIYKEMDMDATLKGAE